MLKLFEPGKVGKLTTKNRIAMSPMAGGGYPEPDGRLSQRAIDYYAARAKGGVGLIITSAMYVSRDIEYCPELPFLPRVDGPMFIAGLSELTERVHDYGAKIAVQLTPGAGRLGDRETIRRVGAVAPSALPCAHDPSIMARELSAENIERLVRAFEAGAHIVRSAGIDAIEIHAHFGYLIDQFMTALWNKRTDAYGGDLEGRLKLPLDVIEAIKKGAGTDFPVIFRYGLTHYLEGGREIEEGLEIARRLASAGVDAFDINAGAENAPYWVSPPTTQVPGCTVDLAAMAKEAVDIPVMAAGKLGYPDLAERVLEDGKADFIVLGRALLADPEWPNKVRENRPEDIRPCIGDYEGCMGRMAKHKYLSCAVNPATGMEREFAIKEAERKKSVLVVGGGPGGMEAARVASLRGHKVTLWEKSHALGGNLIPASAPDFKQDYRNLIDYLSSQIKKLGVNIHFGKEATPALIQEMGPDVLFVATGGKPIIADIPGVNNEQVVTASDILLGRKESGKSVLVIGGGLVGCETGLYLAEKGIKVTIVEMLHGVMRDMFGINRIHLKKLLDDNHVQILTDTSVLEITEKGVALSDKGGKRRTLPADTIVLAVGMNSDGGLFDAVKGKAPEVYAIGDCVAPRKVMDAIWEGFRTARLI